MAGKSSSLFYTQETLLGSRIAADRPSAVMHTEEIKGFPPSRGKDLPDLPKTGPLNN
jgi:hypothetical protein